MIKFPFPYLLSGLFIFWLMTPSISYGQTARPVQDKADQLKALLDTYEAYGKFNGSVLVADGGEVIFSHGYGMADWEAGSPNEADTKHLLPSLDKAFTATLILQMVAEGKVGLEAPVSNYLSDHPELVDEPITIHHLLTHTAGTPHSERLLNSKAYQGEGGFAEMKLAFPAGKMFAYSDLGYTLLKAVVETVENKPYDRVLRQKILDPLGMDDTGVYGESGGTEDLSSGHLSSWGIYRKSEVEPEEYRGQIYATVADLHRWDQALYTDRLLPAKYREMMFGRQAIAGDKYYGYGWFLSELSKGKKRERVRTLQHDGGTDGYRNYFIRIPSSQSTIILLSNAETWQLEEVTIAINGILHGEGYDYPKQSLVSSVLATMEQGGIRPAIDHFEEQRYAPAYYYDQDELLVAGYRLLGKGCLPEAAAIFNLSVGGYPATYHGYDNNGEILHALGEQEDVLADYLATVRTSSDNPHCLRVLSVVGVQHKQNDPDEKAWRAIEGEYRAEGTDNWTLKFRTEKGQLIAHDGDRQLTLLPLGKQRFVSDDYGTSLVFTVSGQEVSVSRNGKQTFRKTNL